MVIVAGNMFHQRSNVFIQRVIGSAMGRTDGHRLCLVAVENQLGPATLNSGPDQQCAAHERDDIGGVWPLDHRRSDLCVVFAFGQQSG